MRVLVLGGGGRESAICWSLAQSPQLTRLWRAPGGPGLPAGAEGAPIDPCDGAAVEAFARAQGVDLVVIGPEAPLAAGVSDRLRAAGFRVFGPSKAAARLETSKSFTKEICDACGAPTAAWASFEALAPALEHLARQSLPIVVKADGLAAGKGVTVAATRAEAEEALRRIFGGAFGEGAGARAVIEEFMPGEEASLFALVEGERAIFLAGAQDHKRAFDGDQGPNTGGMGAYSPAPILTEAVAAQAMDEIVRPIAREMARRGTPYQGVIYAGLMIHEGRARLVEINARFGDPEAQAILPRLASDLLPALAALAEGRLEAARFIWRPESCLTVTMAARGYPGPVEKGAVIRGVAAAEARGALVFHAATRAAQGELLADGGRVLNVTALGTTLQEARATAYDALSQIEWKEGFYRNDIGWRALKG